MRAKNARLENQIKEGGPRDRVAERGCMVPSRRESTIGTEKESGKEVEDPAAAISGFCWDAGA